MRSEDRAFCTVKIVASTEFFLLTRCEFGKYSEYCSRLILLNPITGSYYTLPYDRKLSYSSNVLQYGLCFDEANDDFKVVRITEFWGYTSNQGNPSYTTNREVIIYSSRKKSWKKIEKTIDTSYYINGDVAVSGRLLYTNFHLYHDIPNREDMRIGCFDIVAEQWTNDVPLPPIQNLKNYRLSIFEGMLCVLGNDKEADAADGNYSVWVMKEYGVQDCWVMLLITVWNKIYHPIAYREGSKDEVLCIFDERFYWYNLRDGTRSRADFYGVPGDGGRISSGHICKGSLVDFPGGQRLWPIRTRTSDRIRWGKMCKRVKPKSLLPKHDTVDRRHRGR
ncbi:F-box protein At3g07870-like [Silene latifolia]|uniref:F-box protein At3g07870-like n=1 Tax=Silene latifolia TaxID=37657 RepID=UPI003D787019